MSAVDECSEREARKRTNNADKLVGTAAHLDASTEQQCETTSALTTLVQQLAAMTQRAGGVRHEPRQRCRRQIGRAERRLCLQEPRHAFAFVLAQFSARTATLVRNECLFLLRFVALHFYKKNTTIK